MKNKLLVIMLALVLVFSMATGAYADVTITVDPDTDYLTVSGTLDGAAGKRITIEVLNPGKTEADAASVTPLTFTGVFSGVAEVTASANGSFSHSYKLGDISGFYSVRLRPQGTDILYYDKAAKYITDTFAADFIAAYTADSAGVSDRINLINTNAEIIGLDLTDFSSLSDGNGEKGSVITLVGKDIDSLEDFENTLNVSMLTFALNAAAYGSDLTSEIAKYRTSLGKVCSVMELYDTYLGTDAAKSLAATLCGNSYPTTDAMLQDLGDKIVLSSVASLGNYSRLENILDKSKSWLSDNFADYFALTDKSVVNSTVGGKSYATTAALCSAVHSAVLLANQGATTVTTNPSDVPSLPISGSNGGSSPVSLPSVPSSTPEPSLNSGTSGAFDDISDVAWAHEAINALSDKGIISGTGNNNFEPNRYITREEFIKILVSALFTPDENAIESFDDVSPSDWSSKYIATAVSLGIVNGVSPTSFAPKTPVTRQDMAVMIHNAAKAYGMNLSGGGVLEFSDASTISNYATSAMQTLCANGIISGHADGRLAPLDNATRAQCAKLIYTLLQKAGGEI